MKYHKAEFRDLSKTAGHVTQQHTGSLCVTTGGAMCIFPEAQLLLSQVGLCYQSKDTACYQDYLTSSNYSDDWARDGRRGKQLPACPADENSIYLS